MQAAFTTSMIAEDHIPGPKHILYTVKKNDSLDSIAKKFNLKKNQIIYWNQLESSTIKANTTLIMWRKPTIFKSNYFIHTVKKGESLHSIADQFNVTIKTIMAANKLTAPLIKINQKLHIPYPATQHFIPKFKNQLVIHHVSPGDSISSLAHYYQVTKQQIIQLNHLKKGQYLHLGQPIKIIYTHH